jgi:hypothetical protein
MTKKQASIDLILLSIIISFVLASLPVSVMGDESLMHYLFSKRNTVKLIANENCLTWNAPCEVELNDNIRLNLMMPAEVEVTEYFKVSAHVTGVEVERMSVVFKGVEHPHGLLPQPMRKIQPQDFQVKGMLSICGYKKMHWQAFVTVYTERTVYETAFAFTSVDNSRDADVEPALVNL